MSEVPAEPVPVTDAGVVEPVAADAAPVPEPVSEAVPEPVPPLYPGDVVFFDAPIYGESEPGVYAGIVLYTGDGRARVHTLGLAADSADFLATDLRPDA